MENSELSGGSLTLHDSAAVGDTHLAVDMGVVEVVACEDGNLIGADPLTNDSVTRGQSVTIVKPSPDIQENLDHAKTATQDVQLGQSSAQVNLVKPDGPSLLGPLGIHLTDLDQVDGPDPVLRLTEGIVEDKAYCDPSKPPSTFCPPPNFNWVFIHGVWTLVPTKFVVDITSRSGEGGNSQSDNLEIWGCVNQGDELLHGNENDGGEIGDSSHSRPSDDSESDFEVKIRRLLQTGQTDDCNLGARRIERRKKPSSRWNEEAGFISQPPRSVKKKGISTSPPEGTSDIPLLINDWTDIQLNNYCNACGITFDSMRHRDNCFAHLRMLESKRSTPSGEVAETSTSRTALGIN